MERLLEYFIPKHYDLELRINKYTESVQGHVIIEGSATELAKNHHLLKLHAKDLKITSVTVDGEKADFKLVASDSTLHISGDFAETSIIDIKYSYQLNHNMEGSYLSTYRADDREERIVATQFESHYARQVFPCVDEPAAKATFKLKLISTDPDDTILSNMPAVSERVVTYTSVAADANPEAGVNLDTEVSRKIVEFETTPRMSTYLLAFVLGKFHKKSTETLHGVKVTTYVPLCHPKSCLDFPTKIAAETLDFYDDLFGTPYPLPKLDQVAIPDFEAGAMENWGLVTYREACLLVDKNTTKSDREYIATVITHELSHQWFGNLVTMKWWDNLWLNESFATLMQYYSVDKLHPSWNIWHDFFTSDCYYALRRDTLPGVQAVQQAVHDPAEIASLFDSAIVYAKGSHLMFMLMRLMGERAFFAGLKTYFKTHKFDNTTGDDLWIALQPHADFDVKEFMDAWISQPGFPMITDLVQQRFLITGATDDSKWPLPKITDDMSGHYILNLSATDFNKKLDNFDKLSLEQRLRLLIDRELLAQTPIVSAGSLIDLLPKFRKETNEPIWEILADIVGLLKVFCLPDTEYHKKYQRFVLNLATPRLKQLGLTERPREDDGDTKTRTILVSFALFAEDPDTTAKLAAVYTDQLDEIDSELRSSILIAKLRSTNEKILGDFIDAYTSCTDPCIKSDLLGAITSVRRKPNVKKIVSLLEQPEIVRPQDHAYLLSYLLSNFYTRDAAYEWFYGHWDYIKSLTSDKSLDDYIRIAAARIRTEDESKRFFEFCDKTAKGPGTARSIEVAHTDILARLRWLKEDATAVRSRL